MPRSASGGPVSDLGGCAALRPHVHLICTRSWVMAACSHRPGSGPGKAQNTEGPSRARLRVLGSRSPTNPAYRREGWARYVPSLDRLQALGHLGPGPLYPLETARNVLFRLFRLFRLFLKNQAALAYPPDQNGQNGGK